MAHHSEGMSRWTPWNVCVHFESEATNRFAEMGSDAHEKLQRTLLEDYDLVLDDTDILDRAVKWAAGVINECKKKCGLSLYTEEAVEIKPELSNVLAGIFGTVDAFGIQHCEDGSEIIHVFDFKSLNRGGSDHSPQLKGYAIAIASMLGKPASTKVCLHILLGGVFKEVVVNTDIAECVKTCEDIVVRHRNKTDETHCPCEWCKYCKNASTCPATMTQVEVVQSGGLKQFSVPKRLVLIETLEGILKKCKEEAKAEVEKAPNKTLTDEGITYSIHEVNGPAALAKGKALDFFNACQEHGVSADEFLGICKVSKTEVLKLLGTKGLKQRSKNADELTATSVIAPFYVSNPVAKLERIA